MNLLRHRKIGQWVWLPIASALLLAATMGMQAKADSSNAATQTAQVQGTVYLSLAEELGGIVKLEDLKSGRFTHVITGIGRSRNILCGPDGRLYFNELFTDGGMTHKIWRINQNGQGLRAIAQWTWDDLQPSAMVFAPNGDLFLGTNSTTSGLSTKGIWCIPDALRAEQQFNLPQQVLPGYLFTLVPSDDFGNVEPFALLSAGPFAGDLLIIDCPTAGIGSSGLPCRLLRAVKPGYKTLKEFIAPPNRTPTGPAGIAVNSQGEVFVTDWTDGVVLQYEPDGTFKRVFATLQNANQIAIGPDDMVYITNAVFDESGAIQGGLFVYNSKAELQAMLSPGGFVRGVTICLP